MMISGRTKQKKAALPSDACVRIAAALNNRERRNKMQKKRWFALLLALVLVMSLLPISPARYAMMINDLVMGTNNYYVYYWY